MVGELVSPACHFSSYAPAVAVMLALRNLGQKKLKWGMPWTRGACRSHSCSWTSPKILPQAFSTNFIPPSATSQLSWVAQGVNLLSCTGFIRPCRSITCVRGEPSPCRRTQPHVSRSIPSSTARYKCWETLTDFHKQLSNGFGKVFKWLAPKLAARGTQPHRG